MVIAIDRLHRRRRWPASTRCGCSSARCTTASGPRSTAARSAFARRARARAARRGDPRASPSTRSSRCDKGEPTIARPSAPPGADPAIEDSRPRAADPTTDRDPVACMLAAVAKPTIDWAGALAAHRAAGRRDRRAARRPAARRASSASSVVPFLTIVALRRRDRARRLAVGRAKDLFVVKGSQGALRLDDLTLMITFIVLRRGHRRRCCCPGARWRRARPPTASTTRCC